MKRIAFVLIVAFCLGANALAQQTPSPLLTRRMNIRLLELLDRYEKYSRFENTDDAADFKTIFVSDNSQVICDFPTCLDFGSQIPVGKYVKFSEDLDKPGVVQTLFDVRRTEYSFKNGHWTVEMSFTRQISYTDKLGMSFSSVNDLVASCVYDADNDKIVIDSISGINQDELRSRPWFTLPGQRFYIVRNTSFHDSKLLSGKSKLKFDGNYAYATDGNFRVKDDDLLLKRVDEGSTSAYTKLSFQYKPMRWRARLHGDFALNGGFRFTIPEKDRSKISTVALSYGAGAEIGYMLGMGSVFKFGLYTGLGVDVGNIMLHSKGVSYDYVYSRPANPGIQNPARHYDIQSADESMSIYSVFLPVYFATEYKLASWLYLSADVGPRFYFNTMAMTPYTIKYNVDNGPQQSVTGNNYLLPARLSITPVDMSLYGRLGLDFAYRRHVLGVRVGFEYGVIPSLIKNEGDRSYAWFDDEINCYPIVYEKSYGDVLAYSLSAFTEFQRMAVWLEVGYKFKF